MKKEPKKGMSLKTKLILCVVGVLILLGIGFYLGLRMQRAYNRFLFNMSQNMIGYSFWAVIILAIILICFIIYLVFKIKHHGKDK